jgi:hypothetical protein
LVAVFGQAPARAEAPGDLQEGAGALAARILETRGLVDDQDVKERVIVGKGGELADEPGHEVDADHRHVALGGGGKERLPLRRAAVEHSDAQVLEVPPGRDLGRPYGGRHEFRRDDEAVTALIVADQLSNRRKGSSALAGTERGDRKGGVAFVQERCKALLIGAQDAGADQHIHDLPPSAAFDLV